MNNAVTQWVENLVADYRREKARAERAEKERDEARAEIKKLMGDIPLVEELEWMEKQRDAARSGSEKWHQAAIEAGKERDDARALLDDSPSAAARQVSAALRERNEALAEIANLRFSLYDVAERQRRAFSQWLRDVPRAGGVIIPIDSYSVLAQLADDAMKLPLVTER